MFPSCIKSNACQQSRINIAGETNTFFFLKYSIIFGQFAKFMGVEVIETPDYKIAAIESGYLPNYPRRALILTRDGQIGYFDGAKSSDIH